MTIRETLRTAFQDLVEQEQEMLAVYDKWKALPRRKWTGSWKKWEKSRNGWKRRTTTTWMPRSRKWPGVWAPDIGLEHKVDELSGGQRTKVLLTKLLLENPDILLLDEPTNYLDAEHIQWLTRYLQDYENAFILISHDVPFLNAVTNIIWHVDNLKLDRYTGNYEKFEEMAALKRRQEEAAYERQQRKSRRNRISSPGTKPGWPPGAWPTAGRRSWTKWSFSPNGRRNPNPISGSWRTGPRPGSCSRPPTWCWGTMYLSPNR